MEYVLEIGRFRIPVSISEEGYRVDEPQPPEELLNTLHDYLLPLLPSPTESMDMAGTQGRIIQLVRDVLASLGREVSDEDIEAVAYRIWRDGYSYRLLTPLLHDDYVEEVSATDRGIHIIHREYSHLGWLPTNIKPTGEELENIARRLANICGREFTVAQPFLESSLPNGDRLTMTYGGEISLPSHTITIRRFPRRPLRDVELIMRGAIPPEAYASILAVLPEKPFIIFYGPVASGKTTLLNSVASSIPHNRRVLTIEDTPELNLGEHPLWTRLVTRPSYRWTSTVDVDIMSLLKLSLRMRPDYLILGETRGEEAKYLIQASASGSGCLTTFHAPTERHLYSRLTSPPIGLEGGDLRLINMLVGLESVGGVRRVSRIVMHRLDGEAEAIYVSGEGYRHDLFLEVAGEVFNTPRHVVEERYRQALARLGGAVDG